MTEREFQQSVIELARLLGFRVAHFRPAQTSKGWRTPVAADGAGFPDLVLVGRGRVVYLELKVGRGTVSVAQEEWMDALRAADQDAYVVYPGDFDWLVSHLQERRAA